MLNIGLVDVTGLDTKAELAFRDGDWNAGLTLRYSFQQALDHSTPGSGTWGNQIPYIPVHSGGIDFVAVWKRWSLAWDTTFTGERWSRSANIDDYRIAPWSVSDASLSCECVKNQILSISASLRLSNVFDYRYQIVQGYPMPGRSILAFIDISF